MSLSPTRSSTRRRPASVVRSTPKLRLPRLMLTNCDDMLASPPKTRLWSGKARLSMRITSAPWSRSSLPVSGPAISWVNSRHAHTSQWRLRPSGARLDVEARRAERRPVGDEVAPHAIGVGADRAGGLAEADPATVEVPVARRHPPRSSLDDRVDEGAAAAQRFAGEQVRRCEHRRRRDVAALRLLGDRLRGGVGEERGVDRRHDVGVQQSTGVGLEVVVPVQLRRVTDPLPQGGPLAMAHDQGSHEAVARREGGMAGRHCATRVAADAGAREHRVGRLHERLVDRHVDVVAVAHDGAVPHRDQGDIGAHGGGDLERGLPGWQQWRTTSLAAQRQLARQRVHDRVRAHERRVGPGRPERRRRHDHELRVLLADRPGVESGRSGVEPHVGVGEQGPQLLAVAHDRPLVHVAGRRERIERDARAVDPDDVGAEVGQQAGAAPRRRVGGVDDTQAAERQRQLGATHSANVTGLGTVCQSSCGCRQRTTPEVAGAVTAPQMTSSACPANAASSSNGSSRDSSSEARSAKSVVRMRE